MSAGGATVDTSIRRTVLPNGLTVLSEHVPGVRSVSFGAWVRAASVHETPDVMGVSHLLEHMVFKGTERRTAHEIALALEALGGSLDAYTAREHTVFQARVLDEHLEVAADVIADLTFHPLLRASDLGLERKVVLEEIAMVDDTPDDLVFELHNAQLWGAHPYGYSILGTRDTVSALEVADLERVRRMAYHPRQMMVAAAGNVDHDRLIEILDRTGWGDVDGTDAAPRPVPPPVAQPPVRRHVERDGAQSHIVAGSLAPAHGDPRRYPVMLLSMLLGGGMSSRLFQRVREQMGLAYSVYTFQSFHADTGMHGVYVGTGPDQAAQALDAIVGELAEVAAHGLPDDEIAMGKTQLKGQVTLSLESVTARMYRAASVELYDEPYRTLDDILAVIEAITPDAVTAAAAEYFDPEKQTVLTLGPMA